MKKNNCAIFIADGFEECEALITVDMLRRGNIEIDMISMNETKEVHSSHNITMMTDKIYTEINPKDYEVLILPGGVKGTANLEANESLKEALQQHYEEGKLTCAICAAPSILGHMGILKGKKYTCAPSFKEDSFLGEYQMELAVKDGNLITGRGMGATIEFAREILKVISDEETLIKVQNGIQYEHTFKELSK